MCNSTYAVVKETRISLNARGVTGAAQQRADSDEWM